MWGNRLGWTISLLIVLATAAVYAFVVHGVGLSAPTEFSSDPRRFEPLQPPVLPVGTTASTSPATTATYRAAIDHYFADRALYDDFAALGKLDSPKAKRLVAIEKLVEASGGPNASVLADRPADVINYDREKRSVEALRVLGRVLVDRLALLSQRAGKPDDARKYADAAFVLGRRLWEERLAYPQFELGTELLGKSTAVLIRLAESSGEADRAAALKAFDQQRVQFVKEQVDPVLRVVRTIDPKHVGRHAGDVFQLVRRSKEPMWRIEAVLALGRLRYFAGDGATAADQREALRVVTELATSASDPSVRLAATAARDLTVEQHRMQ